MIILDINARLKNEREKKGLSLSDLSKVTGIAKSTLQRYETGSTRKIPMDSISIIEQKLGLPVGYLMGWNNETQYQEPNITNDYTTFPVIGDIAAGFDHIAIEEWKGETIDVPNSYLKGRKCSDFFVLSVKGDSMFPTYQDGDKVLILKQSTLDYSGQIGAVIYDDDTATLKKVEYKQDENWLKLVPINPNYTPVYIENERLEHCRVLGIPQLLIREIKDK